MSYDRDHTIRSARCSEGPGMATPVQPGDRIEVVVDGAPREGVVVRVRGDGDGMRAYVKYDAGDALYRCAWVPAGELTSA